MDAYQFTVAKNHSDLERFYPLMKELRQNLSLSDYLNLYLFAHASNGYEIVALESTSGVLALMGYRILYDYVHGKHLYIDDLVSNPNVRGQGHGTKLLEYAEKIAKDLDCNGLRLCTGIDNDLGKKFYEKNNWKLKAYAFKKKLNKDNF